jgi:hypothetical protein
VCRSPVVCDRCTAQGWDWDIAFHDITPLYDVCTCLDFRACSDMSIWQPCHTYMCCWPAACVASNTCYMEGLSLWVHESRLPVAYVSYLTAVPLPCVANVLLHTPTRLVLPYLAACLVCLSVTTCGSHCS